jgi:serine/threonine protein kinase
LQLFYGKRAWMGTHPLFIMSLVAEGGLPFEIPTDVPPALAALLASCLHLNPAQRPTIAAVLAEVQQMTKEARPPGRNSSSPREPTSPMQPAAASPQQQQQQPTLGSNSPVTASRRTSLSSQSSLAAAGRARASTAVSPFAAAASIATQPSS